MVREWLTVRGTGWYGMVDKREQVPWTLSTLFGLQSRFGAQPTQNLSGSSPERDCIFYPRRVETAHTPVPGTNDLEIESNTRVCTVQLQKVFFAATRLPPS